MNKTELAQQQERILSNLTRDILRQMDLHGITEKDLAKELVWPLKDVVLLLDGVIDAHLGDWIEICDIVGLKFDWNLKGEER